MAQVDYFLKLDGIKGESFDAKHKDEIELVSFSWGVSNPTLVAAGGGGAAGKAQFTDFEVAAPVSLASPKLFLACASGQHIKEGTLVVRKSGEAQVEYLKFKLSDILVSSYQETGNNEEDRPLDVVAFNFAKVEMTYTSYDATGKARAVETASWDLKQGKKI